MRQFFTPILESIVSSLRELRTNKEILECKFAMLVGGFSESPMFENAIRKNFESPQFKVFVPLEAQSAILFGGIEYALRPSIIKARVARHTVGIEIACTFDNLIHDNDYAELVDGEKMCKAILKPFVHMGEEVPVDKIVEATFPVASTHHNIASVHLYATTTKPDGRGVIYTTYARKLASILVPIIQRGSIIVKIQFGGTQIKLVAQDKDGNPEHAPALNFNVG